MSSFIKSLRGGWRVLSDFDTARSLIGLFSTTILPMIGTVWAIVTDLPGPVALTIFTVMLAAILVISVIVCGYYAEKKPPNKADPGPAPTTENGGSLSRDWNLSQAYGYWADVTNEEGEFCAELEQAASQEVITIWGKRNYLNDAIFEPIPKGHWVHSGIDMHPVIFSSTQGVDENYISENSTTKPRNVHDSSSDQYWFLRVTSSEVKKLCHAANV